ncbi:heme-binding protein [Carnobacteriaceae bacterium zg-ZUI78]|uniref:GlcG/HbpS family heme-binding protein n=1 Tax=Granulicatella sp. zg-84 TaxID=2678503 RepID=UPI0013C20CAB|nr:heme-binding protein [Granulicatella sp. zg-84]MBS4749722.1 heme-binding protein [Carnobacteriaceae bacterium zg-ZUI78]NEW65925.1 hypothetical protein [Granulicatella sp. zg-84]QMI85152.1 heme-binding protein [Carnobacteriaceae bacterium zg-84]
MNNLKSKQLLKLLVICFNQLCDEVHTSFGKISLKKIASTLQNVTIDNVVSASDAAYLHKIHSELSANCWQEITVSGETLLMIKELVEILVHDYKDDISNDLCDYIQKVYEVAVLSEKIDYQEHIYEKVLQEVCHTQTRQSIDLHEKATGLLRKSIEVAHELGVLIVFSLVDAHGHVILTYCMENALLVSQEMAYKKAYSAVAMKMPTRQLAQLTKIGEPLYQLETMSDNTLVSLAGGEPIYSNGLLIGGLGISGGSLEQDQYIAEKVLTYLYTE